MNPGNLETLNPKTLKPETLNLGVPLLGETRILRVAALRIRLIEDFKDWFGRVG